MDIILGKVVVVVVVVAFGSVEVEHLPTLMPNSSLVLCISISNK